MPELTTTAIFTAARFDEDALTTIVARSVLEAALAEGEGAELWFEIGRDDDASRLAIDLSAADLEKMLRLGDGEDVGHVEQSRTCSPVVSLRLLSVGSTFLFGPLRRSRSAPVLPGISPTSALTSPADLVRHFDHYLRVGGLRTEAMASLHPIPTPLLFSGFPASLLGRLDADLAAVGLLPVQSGSAGKSTSTAIAHGSLPRASSTTTDSPSIASSPRTATRGYPAVVRRRL
jgi:hypothetical protein